MDAMNDEEKFRHLLMRVVELVERESGRIPVYMTYLNCRDRSPSILLHIENPEWILSYSMTFCLNEALLENGDFFDLDADRKAFVLILRGYFEQYRKVDSK